MEKEVKSRGVKKFTIHFATINTKEIEKMTASETNLQYTLLLLIHIKLLSSGVLKIHLQYTLLLLIQKWKIPLDFLKKIYNTLCYY